MCTLTVFKHSHGFLVTMNRDERRGRQEPGRLQEVSMADANLVYPVDGESGGTWIGINNHGVLLCLLNHYSESSGDPEASPAGGRQSRGVIIPAALRIGVEEEVEQHLQHLQPESFQPFDLFLVSARRHLHFVWDGSCFSQSTMHVSPWFMFTSSAFRSDGVLSYRQNLFREWLRSEASKENPEQVLETFHLAQNSRHKESSVLMARKHSHTKSVVQVGYEQHAAGMRYYPEVWKRNEKVLRANL